MGEKMNNKKIESLLQLDKLVFDKIEFNRVGFKNDKELELELQSTISQREEKNIYRVTLFLRGKKPEEYTIEISLSGYFSIELENEMDSELQDNLITKNTVAILMPYLRSQISILTAQPEVECVVLPPFNISNMVDTK